MTSLYVNKDVIFNTIGLGTSHKINETICRASITAVPTEYLQWCPGVIDCFCGKAISRPTRAFPDILRAKISELYQADTENQVSWPATERWQGFASILSVKPSRNTAASSIRTAATLRRMKVDAHLKYRPQQHRCRQLR